MKESILKVYREICGNILRIIRLALYERRAKDNDMILGRLWGFISPALQIAVYWFVFSVGLRMNSMQGGIPYSVWMVTGIIAWFTLSSTMQQSTVSILGAAQILRSINIPMAIIPAKTVVINLIDHVWMVLFAMVMAVVNGIMPSVYWLEIIYYLFAMTVFLLAFALCASSIGTVVKDFSMILSPIIRVLMYVSYAIMDLSGLSPRIQMILKINPLTYIIIGYRNALLYHVGFWETPYHTACFWVVTLLLLVLGCRLHTGMREKFVDLL